MNILRQNLKIHPYRIHVVHALSVSDKTNRGELCSEVLQRIVNETSLLSRILWTDEVHFHLNGAINSWNYRIWSRSNEHIGLWSPKITVWTGMWHEFILPLYFFEDSDGSAVTVNHERYCNMIRNHVIPHLKVNEPFDGLSFSRTALRPLPQMQQNSFFKGNSAAIVTQEATVGSVTSWLEACIDEKEALLYQNSD